MREGSRWAEGRQGRVWLDAHEVHVEQELDAQGPEEEEVGKEPPDLREEGGIAAPSATMESGEGRKSVPGRTTSCASFESCVVKADHAPLLAGK